MSKAGKDPELGYTNDDKYPEVATGYPTVGHPIDPHKGRHDATGMPSQQYQQVPTGPGGYAPGGPNMYAAGPSGLGFDGVAVDDTAETTGMLAPGMDKNTNMLRWGFIRKVYSLVALQLLLTTGVALAIMFAPGAKEFFYGKVYIPIILLVAVVALYFPLYIWRNKHPRNLIILCIWTCCFALSLGIFASAYGPVEVAMAFGMTAAVVVALTLFTFYGVKKGMSFSFLGPFLFAGLIALVVWSLLQFIFRPSPIGRSIFSLLAVLLFSGYLVYDTELLIKRFSIDEYIIASAMLYTDVIYIFMHILALLGGNQK